MKRRRGERATGRQPAPPQYQVTINNHGTINIYKINIALPSAGWVKAVGAILTMLVYVLLWTPAERPASAPPALLNPAPLHLALVSPVYHHAHATATVHNASTINATVGR